MRNEKPTVIKKKPRKRAEKFKKIYLFIQSIYNIKQISNIYISIFIKVVCLLYIFQFMGNHVFI